MFHRNKRLLFELFLARTFFFLSSSARTEEKNRGFLCNFETDFPENAKKAKTNKRANEQTSDCSMLEENDKKCKFLFHRESRCQFVPNRGALRWMWENVKWSVRLKIKFHWKRKKNLRDRVSRFSSSRSAPLARSRIQLNWIWKMNQNEEH